MPGIYARPMPLNLPLPDWVPWWAQLAILVVAILFGLAFLMVPFAVFGLKGRLDVLEAQLDDIHAELRMLAMRLPDPERPTVRAAPPEPVVQQVAVRQPQRRTQPIDDWSRESFADDEVEAPRRPLRTPPSRDAERGRSEPTLRWPPPHR